MTLNVAIEWWQSFEPVPYLEAVAKMETRVENIVARRSSELIWLLEHPPVYTAGRSAKAEELLQPSRFPVYYSGRGGRYTYHGPGQRVVYVMLDVRARSADVHRFIYDLESWLLSTLGRLGVIGTRRAGRTGIWIIRKDGYEEKIAAIGVRLRHWISLHGIAINIAPNLGHFSGIVPCGLSGYGVTSLAALGRPAALEQVDQALRDSFFEIFL